MVTQDVAIPGAGVTLSASLSCPSGWGPFPGVVLVGGSGPPTGTAEASSTRCATT